VRLIVGLGNPGKTYQHTRHNLGFMILDRVAAGHGIKVRRKGFMSLWGKGTIAAGRVVLAKPQTYMNRSGEAVKALMSYFEVAPESMLVIHDDLDLELGRLKIVAGGGAAGHRGVQSIHDALGTSRYARLKVGIGRPRYNEEVEEYVLSPWYADERHKAAESIAAAAAAVEAIIEDGLAKAMTAVNAGRAPSR